jgi:hypothetical protein
VTRKGTIQVKNIRSLEQVWTQKIPAKHGIPISLLVLPLDKQCLVGTTRGALCLFDLENGRLLWTRFLNKQTRIHTLILANDKFKCLKGVEQNDHLILMAVDSPLGEIFLWDLNSQKCRGLWVTLPMTESSLEVAFDYERGLFEVFILEFKF